MNIRHRRKIIDRNALSNEIHGLYAQENKKPLPKKREIFLKILHVALEAGRLEIKDRLFKNYNGTHVCFANTYLIDQIIRLICDVSATYYFPLLKGKTNDLAITAVGGYGRQQMLPYSDVDILFLHTPSKNSQSRKMIKFILYMLWDLNFKVDYATRSINECLTFAEQDVRIKTSLLEKRFVYGNKKLFDTLTSGFRKKAYKDKNFVRAKLEERENRHQRHNDTRYMLEPNIKNGKGGLRDIQTLSWIAKYIYDIESIEELKTLNILTPDETYLFIKSERFLLTVRCYLHFLNQRANDRLTFNMQTQISAALNYADRDRLMGVERFMKHYFLTTKNIGDLKRIICAAIEHKLNVVPLIKRPLNFMLQKSIQGFTLQSGRLNFRNEDDLRKNPTLMLEIFYVCQEQNVLIHPNAIRWIYKNIKLVNHELRNSHKTNEVFLKILTSKHDPGAMLLNLNEAGILGRFIPAFGKIIGQIQYDRYHSFTVDEHTIRAVGAIYKIESGAYRDIAPLASRVIKKIKNRRVLYLSTFLHDIAKGSGKDHASHGSAITRSIGARLNLSNAEIETTSWLVLNHLTMSMTATKRDLDDPKTILDFVKIVQSLERLYLITVLTTADIIAVGPGIWNTWKSQLLTDLTRRTESVMNGVNLITHFTSQINIKKAEFAKNIPDWSREQLTTYQENLPHSYWLQHEVSSLIFHAEAIMRHKNTQENFWIEYTPRSDLEMIELIVSGPADYYDLFCTLTGAISGKNLSVIEARAYNKNGLNLNILMIKNLMNANYYNDHKRINEFCAHVLNALNGKVALESSQSLRPLPKKQDTTHIHPQVFIDLEASENHTVVEVCGLDRIGLLYNIAQILKEHKLVISSAKISTFGQRVVDVIYIKDRYGMKVIHHNMINKLTTDLLNIFQEPKRYLPAVQDASPIAITHQRL